MFFLFAPGGTQVHSVKFRLWLVVLGLVVILGGYAGYLIPFGTLGDDVVELNHRRNLAEQNKDLLQRIHASLKMLNVLRAEMRHLDKQHTSVESINKAMVNPPVKKTARKTNTVNVGINELTVLAKTDYDLASGICRKINSGVSLFDSIPVLMPVVATSSMTLQYGKAADPFTGTIKMHNGIDFVALPGSAVRAAASGTVRRVENSRHWGKRVVIEHGYGFSTVYAHLGSVSVGQGRRVDRGALIGEVGVSGQTTGPHLHYEVWRGGVVINPTELFPPAPDSVLTVSMGN